MQSLESTWREHTHTKITHTWSSLVKPSWHLWVPRTNVNVMEAERLIGWRTTLKIAEQLPQLPEEITPTPKGVTHLGYLPYFWFTCWDIQIPTDRGLYRVRCTKISNCDLSWPSIHAKNEQCTDQQLKTEWVLSFLQEWCKHGLAMEVMHLYFLPGVSTLSEDLENQYHSLVIHFLKICSIFQINRNNEPQTWTQEMTFQP